jgi:E3 ubiquitin-protein ligase MYCBP2
MEEECESAVGTFKDEYCNICYTEGLGSAPTIRIACGHFFHYSCMVQKLSKKWTGSRITFNFLTCPLCKQIVDHPQLRDQLAPMMKLLAEIRGKAEQRLKIEGNDKDAALCEPSGRYYKKPVDYAMDKFAYYPCFKCKQPYFGGQRQCDAAQAQAANGREAAEDFDASHLICGGCADVGQECKVHGKEFIEWKCKFCCSISNWFCWGNTHFCDSCHKRQVAGDYMTKKKVADLPACPGPALCPLKGEHQPPLTEVCLGCVLCRTNTI